jgi:hypothetical protein
MIRNMRSREEWLAIFQRQAESGLSAAQFCKQNGLCNKHFCIRKKQLLKDKATEKPFVQVVTKNVPALPPKAPIATQQFMVCRIGSVEFQFYEWPELNWLTQLLKAVS